MTQRLFLYVRIFLFILRTSEWLKDIFRSHTYYICESVKSSGKDWLSIERLEVREKVPIHSLF